MRNHGPLGLLPNIISALRLLAAPILTILILTERFGWALLLTVPIAVSDWLDGFLARRLHATSRLGLYLDPAADKVLLVVSFVSLGIEGAIPAALVALVIFRDAVIVIGASLLWRLRHRTEFSPVVTGKLSTALQIATILSVLLLRLYPSGALHEVRNACFVLTALFTVVSGAAYVRKGIRLSRRERLG